MPEEVFVTLNMLSQFGLPDWMCLVASLCSLAQLRSVPLAISGPCPAEVDKTRTWSWLLPIYQTGHVWKASRKVFPCSSFEQRLRSGIKPWPSASLKTAMVQSCDALTSSIRHLH